MAREHSSSAVLLLTLGACSPSRPPSIGDAGPTNPAALRHQTASPSATTSATPGPPGSLPQTNTLPGWPARPESEERLTIPALGRAVALSVTTAVAD